MAESVPVTIVYKSGAKVHLTVEKFDLEWHQDTGQITRASWDGVKPSIIKLGMQDISAVFEGHV